MTAGKPAPGSRRSVHRPREVPPAGRRKRGSLRAGLLAVASGDDHARVRIELSGVEVRPDEWSESCQTAIESVSGYVVAVISVLQSRAVTLASCYLATLAGETAASHMRLAPGRPAGFSQRMLETMPGETHARACLLDHAAELRDALDELLEDEQVTVEVSEDALGRAARVWLGGGQVE